MRQTLMQCMFGAVAPLSLLLLLQTLPSVCSLEVVSTPNSLSRPYSAVQCAKEGTIPDDESDTCATYYLCAVNSDNVLSPVLVQCPGSTVFSRELHQCVDASAYSCRRARVRREAGFQCTAQGRYPNVASTDCKSYYLCTKNTDGTLIAALVNCPSSTIFSADKQSCVQSPPNICPYAPITTTALPQSSTTLSAPSGPFVCPSEGRFVNEQSGDCTTYYLCTTINDQLVPRLTACGSSLIFSPIESKCVSMDGYSCPKLTAAPPVEVTSDIPLTPPVGGGTTATTAATTSSEVTSDIPLTTPSSASSPAIEITTPTVATTTTPTVVTTEPPTPTSTMLTSPSEATTSAPAETTTSSEESTTVSVDITESTTDGNVETTADTPTLTTASDVSTTSSVEITVSTTDATTAEISTTTLQTTTTTTATEASTTINTEVTTVSSSTEEGPTTEATTSGVDQTDESTTDSLPLTTNSAGSEVSSTTPEPILTTPSGVFACSAEGRYPDPNGSNCESYILCIRNSLGTLTPIQFFCPPTTIFSLTVRLCVPASTQRCGSGEIATTTTTLSPTTTTVTPVITTPIPFACQDTGRYPNPGSIYCKSYYLCLYDGNLNLIAVELSCPSGSIFADDVYRCVPEGDYKCVLGSATTTPATTTTTVATTTTTTAPTTTTTIGMAGGCTSAGKFPSDKTNDCSLYQFCVQLPSGELVEFIFKCPGSTMFDEVKKTCSDQVVCARGI
ncbi:mucin-5AC-like [Anopheles maculipalpis]|uniref:mucin-5AC-like n=1 Tax=Anopheles maculipalpis TaxID=1496333 RepID=UPI0021594930|nr:mucin-5AC-like [Anopheles maculipalpis]